MEWWEETMVGGIQWSRTVGEGRQENVIGIGAALRVSWEAGDFDSAAGKAGCFPPAAITALAQAQSWWRGGAHRGHGFARRQQEKWEPKLLGKRVEGGSR